MAKKDDQQQPPGFPGDGRPQPQPEITLIHMERDPVYGEPTAAEVHPDEVANWQEHGWAIAE